MHKEWFLSFDYDKMGWGELLLHNDSLIPFRIEARSGSINQGGLLINVVEPGIWTGQAKPETTPETGMVWRGFAMGWKYRLWDQLGNRTHILIHPDGDGKGKRNYGNGTDGCIGTQGQALELYNYLLNVYENQPIVPVYINTPIPEA